MAQRLTPSTVDNGFILTTPALKNPATSDLVFQRILQCKFFFVKFKATTNFQLQLLYIS